jgi:hypothetical protein
MSIEGSTITDGHSLLSLLPLELKVDWAMDCMSDSECVRLHPFDEPSFLLLKSLLGCRDFF